jgi:uncharacterized protein YndB with AHSA1/START domain
VRWPATFAPGEAELFSHNEVVIAAPCERVWSTLVQASAWPSWYSNAHDVALAGAERELRSGSHFSWTTFGIRVHSEVREFVPARRLAWFGQAPGITAYHAWQLSPLATSCHVVTDETNNGPRAVALRRDEPEAIHDGHARWLGELKSRLER